MRIENALYAVDVDSESGVIRQIHDKAGGNVLISEERLSENFRLLLPIPELEGNYILGAQQPVSAVQERKDGLTLRWDGPLSNAQGEFDLAVTLTIDLADDSVVFRIEVENRTEYVLSEVWNAILGGFTGVGPRCETESMVPTSGWSLEHNLLEHFPENMGVGAGAGMRFPEFYCAYPQHLSMPWVDFYNNRRGRGVYYACHDPLPRTDVLRFEMHPGLARNRLAGNWPSDEEIAAMSGAYPPGLVMSWVHLPFLPPGEVYTSPEVVLQFHEGEWHRAARIYRDWFASRFPLRGRHEGWLRRQHAVQDVVCLLPEGQVIATFGDVPRLARDAAAHGVKAILVSGWNVGGHDNQYPNYAPDPRLGTWQDLAEAIRACHDEGVMVFLFANVHPVDNSTAWYEEELSRYRMMNRAGATPVHGWGMGTLTARMGYSSRPNVFCDPAFPQFRAVIVDQIRRLAEIGVDGVHLDKLVPDLDFNPGLELPPDQACFAGTLDCLREIEDACRAIQPHFCLGVESAWDRTLEFADAWWNWHDMVDHDAVLKFTFPEFFPVFPVVQPWDYANVNNAVRYGYQLLIGPARYTSSMSDEQYRELSAYIAEVLRIREELRDFLLFGEFLDVLGVTVATHEHVMFSTHRDPKTGARACVLVNTCIKPHRATVALDGNHGGPITTYQPFSEPEQRDLPATITIPGERLAIVVEGQALERNAP